MRTGIALIPDKETTEKLIEIENRFHDQFQCTHNLSMEENLPHITLFQSNMIDNISYKKPVRNLAKQFKVYIPDKMLQFTDVKYVEGGWYFWLCEPTNGFMLFQKYAMDKCRPYLTGSISHAVNLTSDQKNAERRFGYAYGGRSFVPHITITRTKESNQGLLDALGECLQPGPVVIERITAFRNDDDSLFQDIIAETYL